MQTMSPLGTMELITLKPLKNFTPEADLEEYAARFGDDGTFGLHIEEAFGAVHTVLDASLDFFMKGRQSEPWVTLDVADKCAVLRRALHADQSRGADYLHRMHGHLESVEHYNRERSRLMRLEFENPGKLTLTEKADLADWLMTAAMELEEWMRFEHGGFQRVL